MALFLQILVIRFERNLIVGLNEMRAYFSVHADLFQLYNLFLSEMIFKMPYANCSDVQLGLCPLGTGRSGARVFDFLVFLNISAWNILVRV
jgi:hypothetical protein